MGVKTATSLITDLHHSYFLANATQLLFLSIYLNELFLKYFTTLLQPLGIKESQRSAGTKNREYKHEW